MDISKYYLFRSSDGKAIQMYRGDGAPTITGGGARWNTIERPRRTSITTWVGNDPYTMDIPVLFDGWENSDSVENAISVLNQMCFAENKIKLTPPPTVVVDGALPVKGATWIITKIEWGSMVIWHTVGDNAFRLRQDAVVKLLQFIVPDRLTVTQPNGLAIPHTVKSGETMADIAKKHGTTKKAIQHANQIRDPKNIQVGQTLRVPKNDALSNFVNPNRDGAFNSINVLTKGRKKNG